MLLTFSFLNVLEDILAMVPWDDCVGRVVHRVHDHHVGKVVGDGIEEVELTSSPAVVELVGGVRPVEG